MDCFEDIFELLSDHRIVLCRVCQFAIVPNQVKTHLTKHHSRLSSGQRQEIVAKVQSFPDLAQEEWQVVYPKPRAGPIKGLPIYYDGLRCIGKDTRGKRCRYVCRTVYGIHEHCKKQHNWINVQKRGGDVRAKETHPSNKLWKCNRACQRFFKVGKWQRYFEVCANSAPQTIRAEGDQRADFFRHQEEDIRQSQLDATEQANRVQGFDEHRSTVVPWLRETGIVDHVRGLKKDEIRAAIALPLKDEECSLHTIIGEMEEMLREAHNWCFDGPECMLTWPCRVVLNRFQSSQVDMVGKTRAFDPYKESGTRKTYFKLAKQFLAYLDRVAANRDHHFSADSEETQRPEDVIELTGAQLRKWCSIRRLARQREAGTDGGDEDGLKDELVDMWMLLVRHDTGARRYRSPLLSFCAMLSVKPSTSSWMEPGNFNSHLSGMIWVVQLLIFYDSARKERQSQGKTLALVKQHCEACLQQTVETPMGEILRWRLLLFHISKDSVGDHQATWDESEQVLRYEDTELHMDQIPTLLLSEYNECRRLLYDDLMLASKRLHRMHAWALKDNCDVDIVGWNFTQHRDNSHLLQGTERALLTAIEQSPRLCQLLLVEDGRAPGGLVWRENATASYEVTVQEFLKRLCVLFHISSGQPVRESEFFSMTWRNTQRRRHITLRHDRVMIHVKYHKGQQQTGKYMDNIRFLAHPISDLLLDYIVYVLPLRQTFLRQSSPRALLSPFLWEKGGKVWVDSRLTRCLEDASARAQIPRLHISNWRQMTVAIVKTKFASQIGCFEANDDDEDAEEMEENIRAMTKQRNHKTQTVNRAYANQTGATFGNVWDGLVRMGLRASTLWQDFWGVETILRDKKRRRDEDGSRLAKRVAMGVYKPRKPWSAEALLGGIRKLYGSEEMRWKSAEQEQALTLIMSWTEQVVAILPTGAGKSLLFMLPCTLPDAGITVLVVPLVSLRGDLLRRVEELKIDHLEWSPGERRERALMFVSVEAAASKDFREYALALVAQQKLDRIVVDECHLTVTAASYRESIVDLTDIRSLRTQFVYLTATLPPSMQAEFEERNHLLRPRVIRAPSNRPNIFYMVRKAKRGGGSLLEQAAAEAQDAQDAWSRSSLFNASRDKIILYVQTRDEASELAGLLGCGVYTAKSGSTEEKGRTVAEWTNSATQPYIVATAALAEGFDYPHVRFVINVNEPESLVLFAQESGRAGRDGERAYSLIILPSTWEARCDGATGPDEMQLPATRDQSLGRQRERRAMHKYLRGQQCFRTSLSEHLDPPHFRRWCMSGDIACEVCKECHQEPIGPLERVKGDGSREEWSTGAQVIRRARQAEYSELARYREDLLAVRGSCVLCRVLGERWDHAFSSCHRRYDVFRERNRVRDQHQSDGRSWLRAYTACFWCWNPQSVCQRTDPEMEDGKDKCEDGDIVLPLCYGIFYSEDGSQWLYERFERRFGDIDSFLNWLGEETQFGGGRAIQAVRIAAQRLALFCLY